MYEISNFWNVKKIMQYQCPELSRILIIITYTVVKYAISCTASSLHGNGKCFEIAL